MKVIFYFLILSLTPHAFAAKMETWKLTALEYPPFTCEQCPARGAMTFALEKALKTKNIKLSFTWLPWSRAIMEARNGDFDGYFPAWPEDCQGGFTYSEPINRSAVGFVERKNNPLKFNHLSELKKYVLGSVQDYGNTLEFNKLTREGVLKTEVVTTDVLNVRKVAKGRIDGALIDENVLKYILNMEDPEIKNSVHFNKNILEVKTLGLCFRNEKAAGLNAKLKAALKNQQPQKDVDEYLKKNFKIY